MGRWRTFQLGFDIEAKIEEELRHIVMTLMLDEFEILCWVNYIDETNLLDLSFNVDDPRLTVNLAC